MKPPVRAAAVVGAGAIGVSWVELLTRHDIPVVVADPDPAAADRVRKSLGDQAGVTFVTDPARAVADADIVFEAGPERLDVKQELFARMDAAAPLDTLLTSSSSGFTPTNIQARCAHPERVLVAHPFNPPDLVPLVEVVGGTRTAGAAIERTVDILAALGKEPVRLHRELPGHVANRLQAALWREAYYLVQEGVVSVADLDRAIASGPGLRWALLGPIATQHLSGGEGGLRHVLEHLGPPMVAWWADLGEPTFDAALIDRLVSGVEDEVGGREEALRESRDHALRELLTLKARAGLQEDQ
ncbi:3-hydroxyacyl-CoA dehydrogenase NAD-binding domain-containing protein [Branchiibius cervicis]|uniref:3-hydroxyacyl-CoA dehydrogenase NAD-binding domain-containing protein n=1 Tax=Branchiibius cervicis TaxID=908252 RepID=A0ABW2AQ60_9MICO